MPADPRFRPGFALVAAVIFLAFPATVQAALGQVAREPEVAGSCPERLPAPRHIAPRNGSRFHSFPRTTKFRWAPVENADSYSIEVDCLHCCVQGQWCVEVDKVWHLKEGLSEPQYAHNFVGAQPGRWRVWAVDTCGKAGRKSDWWEFTHNY